MNEFPLGIICKKETQNIKLISASHSANGSLDLQTFGHEWVRQNRPRQHGHCDDGWEKEALAGWKFKEGSPRAGLWFKLVVKGSGGFTHRCHHMSVEAPQMVVSQVGDEWRGDSGRGR